MSLIRFGSWIGNLSTAWTEIRVEQCYWFSDISGKRSFESKNSAPVFPRTQELFLHTVRNFFMNATEILLSPLKITYLDVEMYGCIWFKVQREMWEVLPLTLCVRYGIHHYCESSQTGLLSNIILVLQEIQQQKLQNITLIFPDVLTARNIAIRKLSNSSSILSGVGENLYLLTTITKPIYL